MDPAILTDEDIEQVDSDVNFDDYEKKADRYLSRNIFSGTKLTGKVLRTAAEETYNKTGKLVPLELALAQGQDETPYARNPRADTTEPLAGWM
jgi:hypothetical protein